MPLILSDVGIRTWSIHITLAQLANSQAYQFDPGCPGTLVGIESVVTVVAATASKLATLTCCIGGVAVTTGGVLNLTTANCDTLTERNAGSAVTAGGAFVRGDLIGFLVSAVTTFVEGQVTVSVRYKPAA